MTKLAPGGRAAKPGLLCRFWGWRRAREERKEALQRAAQRSWTEIMGR